MFHKTCNSCPNKPCLELDPPKLCKSMENFLERLKSKEGYSNRTLRRQEVPYNDEGIALLEKFKKISFKKPRLMSFII